jgi:pantoate--beta-alanine ligase
MLVSDNISNIQKVLSKHKRANKTVGFIPTMGALHQGHLSLIKAAKEKCDIVVVSIYVNPTQFNNADDLSAYPRTLKEDIEKITPFDVDVLFTPSDEIMYASKSSININFGDLENVMEGSFRPGHFSGVGIIVTKLFNIVNPDFAFFGQKDFQQLTIIRKMVNEFLFPIEIIAVPIEREPHGLAMSSRNERLSKEDRQEASIFYNTLNRVKELILNNDNVSSSTILKETESIFEKSTAKLEYLEIVSDTDLKPKLSNYKAKDTVLCIAGYIGNVRLIDNMYLIS